MVSNIIGSAYVRIRALTNDVEKDIKKSLERQLDGIGANLGKSLSDSIAENMKDVRIDADQLIDTSSVQEAAEKVVRDIEDTVQDLDTTVEIDLEVTKRSIEEVKHDIEEVVEENSGKDIELTPSVSAPASRYVSGRLTWLARTRFVRFVTQLDSQSFARVLAALSGARAIGQSLTSLWDAFKDIDKNILKIGTLASAAVYAGGGIAALVSNISSLVYGLMQLSGLAAPMVGILGGFAFGIGTMVAALRDAPVYLNDFADEFREMQDSLSGAFWSNAEEPIENMITTLLPGLRDGLRQTGGALGDFFGSLATSVGGSLVDSMGEMFDNLVWSIQIATNSTDDMASSLDILGRHGSEYLPRMADWWVRINDQFNNFLANAEADGSLQRWTETAISNLAAVGDILKGATRILWEFGSAAADAGGASLQAMGDGLNNIADIISRDPFRSTLVNVLRSAHELLEDIGRESGPAVEDFFVSFGGSVANVFQGVGEDIGRVLENLMRTLGSQNFQSALQTMLEGLTSGLAGFSEFLPTIGTGFEALMRIIGTLGANTLPVLGEVLADVADTLVIIEPSISALITAFSAALGVFVELPSPIVAAAVALLLVKTNAGGLGTAVDRVAKAFQRFRTDISYLPNHMATTARQFREAGAAAGVMEGNQRRLGNAMRTARGAVSAMGTALKTAFIGSGVGLVITAAATALSIFAGNAAEARARTDALRASLDQATGAMTALTDDAIAQSFIENNQSMVIAAQSVGVSLADLVRAYKGEAPEVIERLRDRQYEMADSIRETDGAWAAAGLMNDKFIGILEGGSDEIATQTLLQQELAGAAEGSAEANLTAAEAQQALIDKYGEGTRQIDIQINSLEELIRLRDEEAGVQRDAVSSYADLQQSVAGLNELAAEQKNVWNDSATVWENLAGNPVLSDTYDQMTQMGEAASSAALAMADAGVETEAVQMAMEQGYDAFMNMATAMGIDEQAATDLAISYGLIPKEVITNIEAGTEGAIMSINGLETIINSTEGTITIDGDTYPADVKLGDFLETVVNPETGVPEVTIDGNTFPAEWSLSQLVDLVGNQELIALMDANTDVANDKVSEFLSTVETTGPVMSIDGDTTLAENSRLDMVTEVTNTLAVMGISANNEEALEELWLTVGTVNNAFGVLDIDGDGTLAGNELANVKTLIGQDWATLDIDGDGSLSMAELAEIQSAISEADPTLDIYAEDHTQATLGKILRTIPKSVTIPVYTSGAGGGSGRMRTQADGGILSGVETFANGGLRLGENHRATLARANGTVRIWAEPETGGEAYIPMAKSKRKRSLDLWKTVGKMFGVLPKNFADGGIVSATQNLSNNGRIVSSGSTAPTIQNTFHIYPPKEMNVSELAREVSREIANSSDQL